MAERDRSSLGEMRATISNEIVRLQAEYYGKGPTRAKTYILEDLVVVVLEESFTRAEKTLAERGERDAIEHIRRRFQQQMADAFTSVVEQATGRKVRVDEFVACQKRVPGSLPNGRPREMDWRRHSESKLDWDAPVEVDARLVGTLYLLVNPALTRA